MERSPESEEVIQDIVNLFWETFPPSWHRVRAQIHKIVSVEFDLTGGQFHLLRRIGRGHNSVSQLADVKHISRAAISRGVDSLVNKGYVERAHNPDDRRNITLTLTPQGEQLVERVSARIAEWMGSQFSVFNQSELETINEALRLMREVFVRQK